MECALLFSFQVSQCFVTESPKLRNGFKMTERIILARRNDSFSKWETITEEDLDAINHIDQVFDHYFSDGYDIYEIETLVDFANWFEDNGYDIYDQEEYESIVEDQIDFLHSPEINLQMKEKLFCFRKQLLKENALQPNATSSVEDIIFVDGKRYKLIEE